jgi:hypothetical protein
MPENRVREYPRGIPYQSPDRTPQAGPPRRSFLLPALGALALVLVTATATVAVINLTSGRAQADRDADDRHTESPPVKAKAPAPPATTPAKAAPLTKTARERFLAALGMLSAAQVYQTYLNIGLLADGVENEVYTKAQAEEMLTTVVGLLDQGDRQLDTVRQTELDADDQANVLRIQGLTVLLRRQASALRAYWATGDREQITRYHQARETTWKSLSDALGID